MSAPLEGYTTEVKDLKKLFEKAQQEPDMVNHPPHYTTGKIEVIDFIEDQKLPFHEAQVIKYVCRARHKNNEYEDLRKAAWYLNRLIQQKGPQPAKDND